MNATPTQPSLTTSDERQIAARAKRRRQRGNAIQPGKSENQVSISIIWSSASSPVPKKIYPKTC